VNDNVVNKAPSEIEKEKDAKYPVIPGKGTESILVSEIIVGSVGVGAATATIVAISRYTREVVVGVKSTMLGPS
jgi:uncharacterized protein GlcG (DUF336 family)